MLGNRVIRARSKFSFYNLHNLRLCETVLHISHRFINHLKLHSYYYYHTCQWSGMGPIILSFPWHAVYNKAAAESLLIFRELDINCG